MLHRLQLDSVYILCDEQKRGKRLSREMRSFGSIPYYYESIEQLWMDLKESPPELLILDLATVAEDLESLQRHPVIDNRECSLIFAANSEAADLLHRVNNYPCLGIIYGNIALAQQVSKLYQVEGLREKHKKQIQSLQQKTNALLEDNKQVKEKDRSIEQFMDFHKELVRLTKIVRASMDSGHNFVESLAIALNQWTKADIYAGYELSQGAQKLLSLDIRDRKFISLPSLWLGQVSREGISESSQTMALQVATECMSRQVFSIKIAGKNSLPDLVYYVALNETYTYFQWGLLEELLSSFYRKEVISQVERVQELSQNKESMWSALALLDDVKVDGVSSGLKFFDISLTPLVRVAQAHRENSFAWDEFYLNFYSKLDNTLGEECDIVEMSPHHILLIVPHSKAGTYLDKAQNLLNHFQFWRYFADSSLLISEEAKPGIEQIAPGSVHYLNYLEKDSEKQSLNAHRFARKTSIMSSQE